MQEDHFWLLVSLKLSGEATEEELSELHNLLQQYPEMGLRMELLDNLWRERHQVWYPGKGDAYSRHVQRLSNHLSEPVLQYEAAVAPDHPVPSEIPVTPIRRYRWIWLATGAAASVAAFFLLFHPGRQETRDYHRIARNTVSTRPGSKSKVQLPDGSQVWLNSDSRIDHDESFSGANREVQLSGEAYFDVVKDRNHPFIIHTSSVDIRVLGTTLNIRSYSNEKNTEAVLIRGSIEVIPHDNPDNKILLKPNEKLVIRNPGSDGTAAGAGKAPGNKDELMMILGKVHYQRKDTVATEVLWVKNKLAFDGESLESVALKIERWYNVKVFITDERLKKTQYSAVFEDESLQQVMEALRMTGNFRYTINRKEIIIKP